MMRKDKDYLGIIIDGKWLREFFSFLFIWVIVFIVIRKIEISLKRFGMAWNIRR